MDLLSVRNAKPETDVDPPTIEFAWRLNQEIMDWTGKVDAKAAIILPFESAIFGLAVSLSSKDHVFAHHVGWRPVLSYGGFAALIGALFFSAMVVMPQLNRRRIKRQPEQHAMYFGIMRRLETEELLARMRTTPCHQLAMLCQHLQNTSVVCWRKHSWLQSSMVLLLSGVGLCAAAWFA
jgi:Family of unknown function (DUF5706)